MPTSSAPMSRRTRKSSSSLWVPIQTEEATKAASSVCIGIPCDIFAASFLAYQLAFTRFLLLKKPYRCKAMIRPYGLYSTFASESLEKNSRIL